MFLSQRVPYPPDRGDRITTWNVLRHLRARGARLRVGCLAEEARDVAAAQALAGMVDEVCAPRIRRGPRQVASLLGLAAGQSLSLRFFRVRALDQAVARWLQRDPPDLVYLYSAFMAQYVLGHPGPLRFMQFAELDSDKWRQYAAHGGALARWIYGREARLLLAHERHVARTLEVAGVVSEVEKRVFMRYIPDVEPVVIRNGVDVDHFTSQGDAARHPHGVIFTGVMDYQPNVDGVVWFARECWGEVRRRFPDARLAIVGARPVRAVRGLAALPGVEVAGRVPATPPWFDRAAVAIAPLRLARGVQNKALEAMSMGTALVASPQALQGLGPLPAVPAEVAVVADGRAATIDAVCGLLGDPAQARAIGQRAAAWVRAHFRWEHVLRALDQVLDARLGARA